MLSNDGRHCMTAAILVSDCIFLCDAKTFGH